jgi:hypothetical protein
VQETPSWLGALLEGQLYPHSLNVLDHLFQKYLKVYLNLVGFVQRYFEEGYCDALSLNDKTLGMGDRQLLYLLSSL